ncbi:hypothetical protein [Vulcanisaeta sp. JCM 14467]|uniref:hypothetical protein n=1 Tax=Vulcanisaeta sp. JCM 14467 TaxID=1295370 RepID=UPI000AAB5C7E|nr:hypothetical protein [Vulcanisaeta sp. JCM 14467]
MRYGDGFYAYVNRGGKYLAVIVPVYVFEGYDDIKAQVVEVLRRKLERTKDEKKRRIITKHLRRLAPTEKAAAVKTSTQHSQALNNVINYSLITNNPKRKT